MSDLLILYSVNTMLAYRVSQKYYGKRHYVWCAPDFDLRLRTNGDHLNPPSSSPFEIYNSLLEATARGDRHSPLIANNKSGILHGAVKKKEAGVINESQLQEIKWIVDEAQVSDFRPLLYVIPYTEAVMRITREVHPRDKAHPFSEEYLIESLPRELFHIIQF